LKQTRFVEAQRFDQAGAWKVRTEPERECSKSRAEPTVSLDLADLGQGEGAEGVSNHLLPKLTARKRSTTATELILEKAPFPQMGDLPGGEAVGALT